MNAFTQRLVSIEVEKTVRIPPAVPGGEVRTIMVKVPAMKDPRNGAVYFGVEATEVLDKAKARHMGVLAPQELAELRQRLGLTQKEIAEVLQIGEKTWSRWETGREIVSRSLNVLLCAVYEGKISLPWLRALLNRDEPFKRIPQMHICRRRWGNDRFHVLFLSTWRQPDRFQSHGAELLMNAWSQLRVNTQKTGESRAEGDVCVLGRQRQRDFARVAGKTEEMPLGA